MPPPLQVGYIQSGGSGDYCLCESTPTLKSSLCPRLCSSTVFGLGGTIGVVWHDGLHVSIFAMHQSYILRTWSGHGREPAGTFSFSCSLRSEEILFRFYDIPRELASVAAASVLLRNKLECCLPPPHILLAHTVLAHNERASPALYEHTLAPTTIPIPWLVWFAWRSKFASHSHKNKSSRTPADNSNLAQLCWERVECFDCF